MDLNRVIHESRTALLRRIDARSKDVVSIGASGKWYFDWIHNSCGTPRSHIGVEYYMEKPSDLPDGVQWIANTAGNMPDIGDCVADIVISGQNIEHLWKDEVLGFLKESYRILRPGGLLVLDSPNREMTQAYNIPHPEHMVELTAQEAQDLLNLAGFDVEAVRGILLSRDPITNDLIPYYTEGDNPPWSLIDRCISAIDQPHHSYIWWIHARRSADRNPDLEAVERFIDDYWEKGWPERMQRMQSNIGKSATCEGRTIITASAGEAGAVLFGPFSPILPGTYEATFKIRLIDKVSPETRIGHIDAVWGPETHVLDSKALIAGDLSTDDFTPISVMFKIDEMRFGYQQRLFTDGTAGILVENGSQLIKLSE